MTLQLFIMNNQILFLYLQITLISTAPLLLLPSPWMVQPSQEVLERQLMELQALQQLNAQSTFQMHTQAQPLMVLLPNDQPNPNLNINQHLNIYNDHKTANSNLETEDDDLNSIVIDAASEGTEHQKQDSATPQRAILLVPNRRNSIGGIISAIPFLPIEINVPDTITWAYNGIASGIGTIISIIGRPFQGTPQKTLIPEADFLSLIKQIQTRRHNVVTPIIMMPIDGPMLPIQV